LKVVSGRELARLLERLGWRLIRVRASHHLYGKEGHRIVIPIHGNQTLKVGLQRDLMKQAGLTEDDLWSQQSSQQRAQASARRVSSVSVKVSTKETR
jgi:predicted RNA binding protein YcfA (HicA-like mRNA interferase family)